MRKFGLALSGGGYRAAAFHLGTLRALNKLGILGNIDVMSTISGGSITGAAHCLSQKPFGDFEREMTEILSTKSVIGFVFRSRTFLLFSLLCLSFIAGAVFVLLTDVAWLSPLIIAGFVAIVIRFQFRLFPVSNVIGRAYDRFFFHGKTLRDLPNRPELAIGSTNLQTRRPFTFCKRKTGDSYYASLVPPIEFKHLEIPLSTAVVASSCVPFAFTPVSIGREFFENQSDVGRADPKLIDGGVYDNQGIHKLTWKGSSFECKMVVVSDAGNRLPFRASFNNTITLLIRTVDTFMERIKDFQKVQNLFAGAEDAQRQIAYLSLEWDLDSSIPGFVDNMIKGNVTKDVLDLRGIKAEWRKDPAVYRNQIYDFLEARTGYAEILKMNLTREQMLLARSVGTNLTRLSRVQIQLLSQHAANVTELQVKLYCPGLLAVNVTNV